MRHKAKERENVVVKSPGVHNETDEGIDEDVYYTCAACHKTFDFEEHLEEHEDTHEDKRPHICKICRKRCFSKLNLKKHERVHAKQWFVR